MNSSRKNIFRFPASRGLAVLAIFLFAHTAAAQVIRLKPAITVDARQDIRLGDMATVSGAASTRAADDLANTVIISGIEKPLKIRAEQVLIALIAQSNPEAASALRIAGAPECDITLASQANMVIALPQTPPAPPASAAIQPQTAAPKPSLPATQPVAAVEQPAGDGTTLSEIIKARIRQDSPGDELSVEIESTSPLLDHPIPAGRKWLCRPVNKALLGTVQFEAKLVEGTKIIEQLNIQITVKKYQVAAVATRRLARGDIITAADVRLDKVALDRKVTTLFDAYKDVVGLEIQRDIDIGAMIDQRDCRPAYLAHKNDALTVYYIAGALTVQMRGRAMTDAKLHEQLQVRNEATHDVYDATVIGKDMAVAGGTLTAEQEKKLRDGL